MPRTFALALAALVLAHPAHADEVMRYRLDAPILFVPSSTPPDTNPNDPGETTELSISLPGDMRSWATIGDGFGYSTSLSGGVPPYVVSEPNDALPPGLTLNPATGEIAGWYSAPGSFAFRLHALDSSDPQQEDVTDTYTVEIAHPLDVGDYPAPIMQATTGAPFAAAPSFLSGGTPPYAASTSIPVPGVDSASGAIAFTPSSTGEIGPFSTTFIDARGREATTGPLTINVSPALSAHYPLASYAFRQGVAAAIPAPTIAGGRGARTIELSAGAVPAGMTYGSDGSVSGTPTDPGSGNFSTSVTDVDARNAVAAVNWTVSPGLTISGVSGSYTAIPGEAFSITPSAANADGAVSWSLSGSLPDGLSFSNASGAISGTPSGTASTSTGLVLTANDATGSASTSPFSIQVAAAYVATISTVVENVVLPGTYFTPAQWSSTVEKRLVVSSSGVAYSSVPTEPAIGSASAWSGTLTIENHGGIYGGGGVGTTGTGQSGGPGIKLVHGTPTVVNHGTIAGGGGGGGGGGKGGDTGTWTAGTYSAYQINTGNPRYYCYTNGSYSTGFSSAYWNGTSLGSFSGRTKDVLSGSAPYYRYRCSTSGSYYFDIQRAPLTFSTSSNGGAGGRGGDGQEYSLSATAGSPGSNGSGGGGRGGDGGHGGAFGSSGSAGTKGSDSTQETGSPGHGGGLPGYAIEGSVDYVDAGGTLLSR